MSLSVIGILIAVIVGVFLLKSLLHSVRFLFFILLAFLAMIYFFGINLSDITGWAMDAVLWVL